MTIDLKRRQILLGLGVSIVTPILPAATKLSLTPYQTAGPFYPVTLPLDDDSDLTFVTGQEQGAKGEWTDLSGKIIDLNGQPLSSMRIEIWQCDVNGKYRHPHDRGRHPPDPGFQGHGHTLTNSQGEYHFRTIRPEQYPGRTPHIHVAVIPQGQEPFTTQIYIAGDPRNEQDFIYNRIPGERRHMVVADFKSSAEKEVKYDANFDIVMNTSNGTPRA